MFRKAMLIFIMLLLLAGAVAADVSLPVLLMMGGLIVLAFAATVARNSQQE